MKKKFSSEKYLPKQIGTIRRCSKLNNLTYKFSIYAGTLNTNIEMVYMLQDSEKISVYQSAFAGAGAGAFTRAVAQPLDVLKIRFQLQTEPIKNGSKYSSILQAISNIVKEEGITALWSGHVPAQLLSITYGILQFSTFETLTDLCKHNEKFFKEHEHSINFTNGAVAATVATIASFPFDTVRTRLIAEQKTRKAYRGSIHAFSTMLHVEGSLALYKGIMPTLAQSAPHAGLQFAVYKLLTEHVLNKMELFQRQQTRNPTSTVSAYFVAGVIAGMFAKTVIYPFDLVKKRMQIQGFQQHRKAFGRQFYCTGMMHCIRLTIVEEGFLGLFKGYGPSMLKAGLVSALHFTVYDEIKHLLTVKS